MKHLSLIGLVLASLSTNFCLADATIKLDTGKEGPSTVYVKDGIVRMESQSPRGGARVMLFDSNRNVMTAIMDARQSYTEIDHATMKDQMSQMKQMRSQMMEQMKSRMQEMPAEQRKMMEERMAQMEGGTRDMPQIDISKTGNSRKVNGFECEVYSSSIKGQTVGEACVAGAGQLGMSAGDFNTVKAMFRYMEEMAQMAGKEMGGDSSGPVGGMFGQDQGLPVEVSNAKQGVQMQVSSVSTDGLASDLFQVPDGYTKQDMMQPGAGMGNGPRGGGMGGGHPMMRGQ